MLNRNINAATGVSASTAPAIKAARGPDNRRTAEYGSATAPTPMSACGTSMLHDEKPNTRAASAMTHSAAGGLSTVTTLPASSEPNRNAVQFCVIACTAAA